MGTCKLAKRCTFDEQESNLLPQNLLLTPLKVCKLRMLGHAPLLALAGNDPATSLLSRWRLPAQGQPA
jgi:hypothetical protein